MFMFRDVCEELMKSWTYNKISLNQINLEFMMIWSASGWMVTSMLSIWEDLEKVNAANAVIR